MGKEKNAEISLNEKAVEIGHAEKEELKKIIKEYRKEPEHFYELNRFELWDGGKNPALVFCTEMTGNFIAQVWKEKKLGDPGRVIIDAKSAAMFVIKYLGADTEGGCKVAPETAIENIKKMGETDVKQNAEFILDSIKKNDPEFSKFLTEICSKDIKTGEYRSTDESMAIVEMVAFIARTIYEQMKKDSTIRS